MDINLVLAVIGRDKPGLVNAVSEVVTAGGGNWLETHMASLAGQFAGILQVSVPVAKADALIAALKQLETKGLKLLIERAGEAPVSSDKTLALELIGADRPGIVRDLSRVLAAHNVSIAELETERVAGSFSGEPMFKARARLLLPDGLSEGELRQAIEGLANEMMVDLDFVAGDIAP
jgi:glycine cleavage system regulatory protein